MSQRTALFHEHEKLNARIVDFAGWDMPLNYGSQIQEHHRVREDAGMFDVSHMTILDFEDADTKAFLQHVLANDVDKLKIPGKALYTAMLNEAGGVIDDLIVYYLDPTHYRLIVNSGTKEKDIAWLQTQCKKFNTQFKHRDDLSIIAVQGPQARQKVNALLPTKYVAELEALKNFQALSVDDLFVARTGYTGEEGYEILIPNTQAATWWQKFLDAGIAPCGLAARDTLRLEAGLNLYGHEMDETVSPWHANLAWTLAFEPTDRLFIGRKPLEKEREEGVRETLIGLVLQDKGVLRQGQTVHLGDEKIGITTSGGFSPTLNQSIALARVKLPLSATECLVDIRGKLLPAQITKPVFVRNGKPVAN